MEEQMDRTSVESRHEDPQFFYPYEKADTGKDLDDLIFYGQEWSQSER
ncbi:MAG: hypothetical protein HFJ84_07025 [Clostridiales bacterium]|nr:hypothetical protein [Clostridiales bacterium]